MWRDLSPFIQTQNLLYSSAPKKRAGPALALTRVSMNPNTLNRSAGYVSTANLDGETNLKLKLDGNGLSYNGMYCYPYLPRLRFANQTVRVLESGGIESAKYKSNACTPRVVVNICASAGLRPIVESVTREHI